MAAAALRRSAKTTPNRTLTQSWPFNSGQVTEDGSRNPALVLASEQQQSSASILAFPQQQNQQAGAQTQSASSLDQPQIGSVQYQPTGNNLEPPTTDALGQYQPAGNNETPLAGDDLNSDVIVDAAVTMPCRDRTLLMFQTFRCQTHQQYMTLLHQDASLEEDAANGVSVHNLPQVNASVLPATCVEYDSLMVKRVCNSGVTVKPIIATYMHIVSTEDLVMIMNYWLMQSPANGTPSPEQRPDQASTAAPPDDERDLFGREEALRMDEEIMDFQWFEHVTWDSIKDLRGTTYVQPPTRFRFALQHAQHAILRAIIHNNPTSLASESAWKALVLSSWLLLGRPATHTFWMRDWTSLGLRIGLLSGPWFVLNVMLVRCRTRRAERTSSRCRHVFAKSLHWRVLVKKEEP